MGMYDGETVSWVVERDRRIGAALAGGLAQPVGAGLFGGCRGRSMYGDEPASWVVRRDRMIGAQTSHLA
jgi:hypothetical protein